MASNSTYQYVAEPVSGLECVICLEVAEDPWQHGHCGRLLCKECLDKLGRNKPCPNCRQGHPKYFQDNKSKRDIQALVVKCPNAECDDTMERRQAEEHVNKCPHTVISCKYEHIGCDAALKREVMAAHEQDDDKLHLHMALDVVDASRVESQTLKNGGSITIAVPGFQKEKNAKAIFLSSPFYTHPNGYHMALEVYVNGYDVGEGTHVSVYVSALKGKYDAGLKWPLVGEITITVLNQLVDELHGTGILSLEATDNVRVGFDRGFSTFIPHSKLAHDPVKNTQYLKDDTLYFRVSAVVADHKPWLETGWTA